MTTPDLVDQFIQSRVQPEFHDIVQMLRELMRECVPDAREVLTYGIFGWKRKRISGGGQSDQEGNYLRPVPGCQFRGQVWPAGGSG